MSGASSGPTRRRLLTAAPLAAVAAAGTGFWAMLEGMQHGSFDPHDIHAPALNRRVPDFDLPAQAPGLGFSAAELRGLAMPVVVNFFASWCVPCVVEAPLVAGLAARLPVWGIAYQDKPDDAEGFVRRSRPGYARVAADRSGLAAIDWGVSGVPESFLIRPGGMIAWHLAGPLTADAVEGVVLPLAARLRA